MPHAVRHPKKITARNAPKFPADGDPRAVEPHAVHGHFRGAPPELMPP
ncbi:MAG TPA: hypothetical protein VLW52_05705 [Opitutaceae bacterium]|nr:hypothetical protein [Opitutaceae bacterium]